MVRPLIHVKFTPDELKILSETSRSRKKPKHHIQRARMLLLMAQNCSPKDISKKVGVSLSTVSKLKRKAKAFWVPNNPSLQRPTILELLNDQKRTGRPLRILLEQQQEILKVSCSKPSDFKQPGSRWTLKRQSEYFRERNQENGNPLRRLSKSYISKIHKRRQIRPHKNLYYLQSNDPNYKEKVERIATIYRDLRNGQLNGKVVISVDEKTSIQAIKSIREELPPVAESHCYRLVDPEYKRLGTTNLFGGFDLESGEIYGLTLRKNSTLEFCEFLKELDSLVDDSKEIILILDNYGTHRSKALKEFLKGLKRRFEFVFLPTHSSWMNPIEGVFSRLSRGFLRDLRVNSLEELEQTIKESINEMNLKNKKPANWDRFIQRFFNRY